MKRNVSWGGGFPGSYSAAASPNSFSTSRPSTSSKASVFTASAQRSVARGSNEEPPSPLPFPNASASWRRAAGDGTMQSPQPQRDESASPRYFEPSSPLFYDRAESPRGAAEPSLQCPSATDAGVLDISSSRWRSSSMGGLSSSPASSGLPPMVRTRSGSATFSPLSSKPFSALASHLCGFLLGVLARMLSRLKAAASLCHSWGLSLLACS